jgi:hypothetical protein
MLTQLRRAATVVAAAAITIGTGAGAALAFQSGGNPAQDGITTSGADTITWTHNGQDSIQPGDCSASVEPNGQPANTPYLL